MGVGRKFAEAGGAESEGKEEEDERRLLVGSEGDYHEQMFNFIKGDKLDGAKTKKTRKKGTVVLHNMHMNFYFKNESFQNLFSNKIQMGKTIYEDCQK